MKTLITGGAGYVGSVLVRELLRRGHGVRVLDNLTHGGESLLGVWSDPGFEFIRGDVCEAGDRSRALEGVEAVVHLAAIVGDPACARQPDLTRKVNLEASLAMAEAARSAGAAHFVFASTCSNYGKMEDSAGLVDETSALRPVSLYAETKVAVEQALLEGGGLGALRATCLRFATVYGVSPRPRFDLTINEFVLEMLTGKELSVFGEQFWRPYIHVCDLAEAVVRVLEAPPTLTAGQVFNVGNTEQNFTKAMLVEAIRPHAPAAVVRFVHKEDDPRDYRVSFERIKQVLGFTGCWKLERGIEELVSLIRSGVLSNARDARFRN
jgi:nucleoside-diphosphate-sugar epimerase